MPNGAQKQLSDEYSPGLEGVGTLAETAGTACAMHAQCFFQQDESVVMHKKQLSSEYRGNAKPVQGIADIMKPR